MNTVINLKKLSDESNRKVIANEGDYLVKYVNTCMNNYQEYQSV